ncbi:MAG: carbohydrate kinase family protein [Armatimonadota bacterium]
MDTSQPTGSVLCIGDMVADVFASAVPRLPQPGEMLSTDRVAVFPGGNALNTAVALRRLGADVAMVGSIGDDALADLLTAQLRQIGLDLRGVRRQQGASTAATVILRVEGEDRRYVHSLGASGRFTGENVPDGLIPHSGVLFVGGYLKLAAWHDQALVGILDLARGRHSQVVLNVSIPREGGVDLDRCLRLLPHVDVFVPNEDEARLLTGETTPAAQARALREAGAKSVVITRGPEGLHADDGSQVAEMGVFSVPVVDPSGCGDCFTAGLIMGLLQRWGWLRALEFASAVAALGLTALGCTSGVPPLEEALRFMDENEISMSLCPSGAPESQEGASCD